jgi:hypothetical protein
MALWCICWNVGKRERGASRSSSAALECEACGKRIEPRSGTSKQYVCAGKDGQISECQKIRRYAREHGISVAEVAARRCR